MSSYDETGMLHALVIDDDPHMLTLMAETLLPEGVQVIPAESAEAGLAQLPYYRFDAAFIDQMLPGMEGLVFGEYLQRNNPEMAITLVTGSSEDGLERRCREHGIRLVAKPFDPEVIVAIAHAAMERRDAASAQEDDASVWHPSFVHHLEAVSARYDLPSPPQRLEDALVRSLRDVLTDMSLHHDHTEEARVVALAGLLACRVLGVRPPHTKDGMTWFQLYDEVMVASGRRPEFGIPGDEAA
jgi:DNA-binding response OmpR family regulator